MPFWIFMSSNKSFSVKEINFYTMPPTNTTINIGYDQINRKLLFIAKKRENGPNNCIFLFKE